MMYDGLWPLCPDRYILSGFQTTSGTPIPNMRQVPLSGGGGGDGALYLLSEYFAVFGRTWLSDCKIRLTR